MNMDHPHVIKNITGYNIVDDENVSETVHRVILICLCICQFVNKHEQVAN